MEEHIVFNYYGITDRNNFGFNCKRLFQEGEVMAKKKLPKLMTKADMATRWNVSRQVVKNWESRKSDFPSPIQWVSNDSIPLYLAEDVYQYEKEHNLI